MMACGSWWLRYVYGLMGRRQPAGAAGELRHMQTTAVEGMQVTALSGTLSGWRSSAMGMLDPDPALLV